MNKLDDTMMRAIDKNIPEYVGEALKLRLTKGDEAIETLERVSEDLKGCRVRLQSEEKRSYAIESELIALKQEKKELEERELALNKAELSLENKILNVRLDASNEAMDKVFTLASIFGKNPIFKKTGTTPVSVHGGSGVTGWTAQETFEESTSIE